MTHTNEIPILEPTPTPDRNWTRGYIRAALAAIALHLALAALLIFNEYTSEQLLLIGTVIYSVGVVAGLAFLIVYSLLARWWKTPIGLLFELIGLAIVTTGIVVLASLVFGTSYPGREQVRIIGYLLFTDSSIGILITYLIERGRPKPVIPVRAIHRREHS